MVFAYLNEVKGQICAYRFSPFEKEIIASGIKPAIKKLEKEIEKISNHPKNEGQATYSYKIDELRVKINSLNEIVEHFTPTN